MTYAHTYGLTIAGAAINEAGSGLVLPTLVTWVVSRLPVHLRGRGTGAWLSSFALGQFASPLLVLALVRLLGGRVQAIHTYAIACGVAAIVSVVAVWRRGVRTGREYLLSQG